MVGLTLRIFNGAVGLNLINRLVGVLRGGRTFELLNFAMVFIYWHGNMFR